MSKPISCHIFCSVIDNFGDIGVSWRLARHLSARPDVSVVLFVDDLISFQRLAPSLRPTLHTQTLGDLIVHHWTACRDLPTPADIVIEAFACSLPAHYVAAMAERKVTPEWINLEYLSAEDWIEGCHRLTSVEPQFGLSKTFWFPGFTPKSGGLLLGPEERFELLSTHSRTTLGRQVTYFGYDQPGISNLLDTLAQDSVPTLFIVFTGPHEAHIEQWLGASLKIGADVIVGALTIRLIQFLSHEAYDRLLAESDLNLVRGEDSFVRAQWAGQALLWNIYPQEAKAHLVKLAAWQKRVLALTAKTSTPMPESWSTLLIKWNTYEEPIPMEDWAQFLADLPDIRAALQSWRLYLLTQPDLATQLMRFYADRVESTPK